MRLILNANSRGYRLSHGDKHTWAYSAHHDVASEWKGPALRMSANGDTYWAYWDGRLGAGERAAAPDNPAIEAALRHALMLTILTGEDVCDYTVEIEP